jgi:hypothetical protein
MTRRQRIATLILGLWMAACSSAQSQETWIEWKTSEGGNGHWYALTAPMTWTNAEARAVNLGGHLASIADKAEDDFIRWTICGGAAAWVGLGNALRTWTWTDGTPVQFWASIYVSKSNFPLFVNGSTNDLHWLYDTKPASRPAVLELPASPDEVRPKIVQPSITWYQWPTNYGGNGHWYGVSGAPQTNSAAVDLAAFWNGSLVAFGDTNEFNFARQITASDFPGPGFRIGLSALPGALYRWTDGSAVGDELPSLKGMINTNQALAGYALSASGVLQSWVGETTFKCSLFELTANPTSLPPYVVEAPVGGVFVSPSTLVSFFPSFGITAVGAGPLHLQWKSGGVELPGATNSGLYLPLSTVATGAVSVVVSNSNGSTESTPAQIAIIPGAESNGIGWRQWPSGLGGNDHWYGILSPPSGLSWSNAQAVAVGLGGNLISLSTVEEAKQFWELGPFGQGSVFWLGITDRSQEGIFQSIDGTSPAAFPWAESQPDRSNPEADFVYASYNGDAEEPYRWVASTNDLRLGLVIVERAQYPHDLAPVVLPLAQNLHLATDWELNLGVDLVGAADAEYQWHRNGEPVLGATNVILHVQQAKLTDAGIYDLISTGAHGSFTSAPISVVVSVPGPLVLSIKEIPFPDPLMAKQFAVSYDFPIDSVYVGFESSSDLTNWQLLTTQSKQQAEVEPLIFGFPAEKTNVFIRAYKIQ